MEAGQSMPTPNKKETDHQIPLENEAPTEKDSQNSSKEAHETAESTPVENVQQESNPVESRKYRKSSKGANGDEE